MAVKKAVYKVDNGRGFDDIFFKTSEDMIVGAVQSMGDSSYRKLPGGLILQCGSYITKNNEPAQNESGLYFKTIIGLKLPVSFSSNKYKIFANCNNARCWANALPTSNATYSLYLTNPISYRQNDRVVIEWFAIGY